LLDFSIYNSVDSREWNKALKQSVYANFFQTAEYLETHASSEERTPVFITIRDSSNNIKGQLGLVVEEKVHGRSSNLMDSFITKFSNLGKRATWVSGPILHDSNLKNRSEILKLILSALEKVGSNYNLTIIDGYTPPLDSLIDKNYKEQFRNFRYKIENFFTFVTDLNKTTESIWDSIHKSTRRDVKRSEKRNIVVKELNQYEQLDEYFNLSKEWTKTKGIILKDSILSKEKYWECLKAEIEKVFLAYENDELITSHRMGIFNGIAFSHKFTNSYSKSTSLGGPLLAWFSILWAKKMKYRIYDFSGGRFPPSDNNSMKKYLEQWDSLLSYKRKWGGVEYPYFHFIKIRNEKSYKLLRMPLKIDWMYRNYKRKHFKRPSTNVEKTDN